MSHGGLAVEELSLRLPRFRLRNVGLQVAPGECLVLLGPNGAGKSVCLEAIAGFHRPTAGRITLGGRELTRLPPEARRVGFLFQSYGLFPHRSVAQNVAMGARLRPAAREVDDLLRRFGIAHLAQRYPGALSPGEKQRTALARALISRVEVYLFDEPFSALDAGTREALRDELAAFVRQSDAPAVFVTHDHGEAAVVGDRIALIDAGAILQQGAVEEVFAHPASVGVARLLGIENILEGRVLACADGLARIALGAVELRCAAGAGPATPGTDVALCIRAAEVKLAPLQSASAAPANRLSGTVTMLRHLGVLSKVTVDCGVPLAACLLSRDARDYDLAPGRGVTVEIATSAVHLVPRAER